MVQVFCRPLWGIFGLGSIGFYRYIQPERTNDDPTNGASSPRAQGRMTLMFSATFPKARGSSSYQIKWYHTVHIVFIWWYNTTWYDIWYMIYDIWYMIYDIWYMIYDIWHMIYDIWYMIYDIWYMTYDIWYMIYDIWYMIWYDEIWYDMIWYSMIFLWYDIWLWYKIRSDHLLVCGKGKRSHC